MYTVQYMEGFRKFTKQILIFKVPMIFFGNDNFAARETRSREAEIADFLELNS